MGKIFSVGDYVAVKITNGFSNYIYEITKVDNDLKLVHIKHPITKTSIAVGFSSILKVS
ncbi:hypothetical protein QB910_000132 [Dabrowskivirus KKP3916]|uniref:Uncharacterized protein n=1 Tax=Alicyclobacillus phage KKP_3916 TaxID=3040651 RepID=A0AAT9V7T6_9CAUD|nr:hypothetical protein QB910_000132 [Alicyclobacillus phage KKP 3916]